MHPRVKLVMLCGVVLYLTAIPARFILATEGDVSNGDVDTVVGNGDDDEGDDDDDGCGHRRHCGRHRHDDDDDDGYTNSCTTTQVFYKGQCVECSSEIRNCINCEIQGDQVVCTACAAGFLEKNGSSCMPLPKSVVSKATTPVV